MVPKQYKQILENIPLGNKLRNFILKNWQGSIVGLVYAVIGIIGLSVCNWNPISGGVVPLGLCSDNILAHLYIPMVKLLFMFSLLFENLVGTLRYSIFVESIILLVISFIGGSFIQSIFRRK